MLKGWFGQLFCKHEYILYDSQTRTHIGEYYPCYRTVEVYVCKKCGKVKKRVIDFK